MEAALFLINESTRVGMWVAVRIEANKLAAEQELPLDFVLRDGALERSTHKLPVLLFGVVASFKDVAGVMLAGLAEILLRVVVKARCGIHTPVPPDGQT
jgi:hypothetical protein